MPHFSAQSEQKKQTLHPDLIMVMDEAIMHYDFTILCGARSVAEQFESYKQGRKLVNGKWVIVDKGSVVTYCDGKVSVSKHNSTPSLAVDLAPFPLDWDDELAFALLMGKILEIARRLREEGHIASFVRAGCDWNANGKTKDERLVDLPHIEIYEP